MGLQKIEIDATPGRTGVRIDGNDVSHQVQRVTVDCVSDQIPRVFLEGHGAGTIKVEGVAIERVTDIAAIQEFLAGVDTEKLEQEALEGLGLEGGATTVGEAIILKLMEWSSGN